MDPENLRYTKEHEWVRVDGDIGTIGITFHAQKELGDIVYVDLPSPGRILQAGDSFGTVESAVECMKNGAFDYLIKPFSNEQIEVTLRKAEEFTQLLKVNRFLSQEDDGEHDMLGHSAAMENLRQLLRHGI